MATISARVDDHLKNCAERIADSIGLSLSSVITVFLKRFVDEKGFPFELKLTSTNYDITKMDMEEITALLKQRIKESEALPHTPAVTYLDPATHEIVTQKV